MNINLKKLHQDIDTLLIQDLLQQGFTKTQIASILNISRQTLFNKEQKNNNFSTLFLRLRNNLSIYTFCIIVPIHAPIKGKLN